MDYSVNFSELCRVCAGKGSDLTSIFHEKHKEKTIADVLSILLQHNVHENDGKPSNICSMCIPKLLNSFDLLTMVKDSERYFQQIILSRINSQQSPFAQCAEPLVNLATIDFSVPEEDPLAGDENKHKEMGMSTSTIKKENDHQNIRDEVNVNQLSSMANERVEKSETRFECDICGRFYQLVDGLNLHLCQGQLITCEYCAEVCQSTKAILQHLNSVHKDDLFFYKCRRCKETFKMEVLRTWHGTKHDRSQFACDICGKQFKRKRSWIAHTRLVHSDERRKNHSETRNKFVYLR